MISSSLIKTQCCLCLSFVFKTLPQKGGGERPGKQQKTKPIPKEGKKPLSGPIIGAFVGDESSVTHATHDISRRCLPAAGENNGDGKNQIGEASSCQPHLKRSQRHPTHLRKGCGPGLAMTQYGRRFVLTLHLRSEKHILPQRMLHLSEQMGEAAWQRGTFISSDNSS